MAASQATASSSMFPEKPKESQSTNLDTNLIAIATTKDFSYVLKRSGSRLLVVEFFAKWCAPCQILSAKLKELAQSYDGRILIVKVDVDEFEALTSEFNILAVPTFVIMKNNKKLQQFFSSDALTLEKIVAKYAGKPVFKKLTINAPEKKTKN